MDQQSVQNKQKHILEKLEARMKELELETAWTSLKDGGSEPVLLTEHPYIGETDDEVIGQYFFLPEYAPDTTGAMDFVLDMIVADEIPEDQIPVVKLALTDVNFVLPKGAYQITPDGDTVSFRHVLTFRQEDSEEEILEMITYQIGMALSYNAVYMDLISDLAAGEITYTDFVTAIETKIAAGAVLEKNKNTATDMR